MTSFTLWTNLYPIALGGYIRATPLPHPPPSAPKYHPMDDVIYVPDSPAQRDPSIDNAIPEPPPFVSNHTCSYCLVSYANGFASSI